MKKLYYSIPIILLAIGAYFFFAYDSPAKTGDNTIVYYIPHQDDEVISFGVAIYNSLQEGKDVHIALLTNGANSQVRKKLNLTKKEFTEARNKEMEKALQALGVDLDNLSRRNFEDGELTVEQVENVMKEYVEKYPNAEHSTFSYLDPHSDHSNSGIALRNLIEEGIIPEGKFYIGPNYEPEEDIEIEADPYDDSYYPIILAASQSYNIVDEEHGFYGIGWKSVPSQFESLESNPRSIYHR